MTRGDAYAAKLLLYSNLLFWHAYCIYPAVTTRIVNGGWLRCHEAYTITMGRVRPLEYMSSMFDVRKTAIIAAIAMSGVFLTAAANAVPTLRLTQGANIVTVSDNGFGDINPLAGVVAFSGTVGDFLVNTTTGVTKPLLGNPSDPILDLNSINVNGAVPGTIVLEFSETDFTNINSALDMVSIIGGTTAGTLQFETFGSLSNSLFATDIMIADSGALTGGILFDEITNAALTGTFSLTTRVTITHTGDFDNSSFNSVLEVPEPSVAAPFVLGAMLIGANLLARRRRR